MRESVTAEHLYPKPQGQILGVFLLGLRRKSIARGAPRANPVGQLPAMEFKVHRLTIERSFRPRVPAITASRFNKRICVRAHRFSVRAWGVCLRLTPTTPTSARSLSPTSLRIIPNLDLAAHLVHMTTMTRYFFQVIQDVRQITQQWTPIYNHQGTHQAVGILPLLVFNQRWQNNRPLLSNGVT
jgi:hypothetical protein